MMLIKSRANYSPIHGLGCFTDVDIKKGEAVWKFDPRLDQIIADDELETFPEVTREFLRMYAYGQIENGKRVHILCADHARHMNHSDSPNLLDVSEDVGLNIAARDIKAGEELTCDYHLFDLEVDQKLGK